MVGGLRAEKALRSKVQCSTSRKWNVYRSARSPLKLINRFPDHPKIGTLNDNFTHAVETFQDYKYLGTRIKADGGVGGYKWMTYGEAETAREAIGSGLRYYGLSDVQILFNML